MLAIAAFGIVAPGFRSVLLLPVGSFNTLAGGQVANTAEGIS